MDVAAGKQWPSRVGGRRTFSRPGLFDDPSGTSKQSRRQLDTGLFSDWP